MANPIDPELAARLREESESTRDEPYPAGTRATRPNRSAVYSIRLTPQEQERVREVAEARHLPPSTLVRAWILEALEQERDRVG